MVLNPQTANFPPISQVERSWEQNLRAFAAYLVPGPGARTGLKLGLPASGLTPTLTDGYFIEGDMILGPYGSKLISIAPAEAVNRTLYFGLSGMYWGDANDAPLKYSDVPVGVVATDADSILHVAQQKNYGAGRMAITGVVNLENCAKGADVTAFDFKIPDRHLPRTSPEALEAPQEFGFPLKHNHWIYDYARITYAQARVVTAATAGFDAGDDFVLKAKIDDAAAVTLATVDDALLDDVGSMVSFAIADADAVAAYHPTSIKVQYNQTDPGANLAGGAIEFYVELMLY